MNSTPDNNSFWHSLFAADSIAVIGAKDAVGTWGQDAMKAALESAKVKASRKVYPVNPREEEVMGLKAYKSALDIPDPVELAIIVVPAAAAPQVFRDCAQKKVKAAVVISAGFAEADDDGKKLEAEIKAIAKEGGMRFTGPNCNGHADMHTRVSSVGFAGMIPAGPLALLSQSGTLGASIMQMAADRGIGISKFVATGNEADLRMEDFLEYLAQDDDTRIIATYIEGLREGRRYYELAKKITRKKPIIAMKSGTTGASAKAARSHTGALAGADNIYTAAFKQAGVIRVEDEEELCDVALALRDLPLPHGNRIGILTIGGGFGVVTAEVCEKEGLEIAALTPETLQKMSTILPPRWPPGNPVDLVGTRPVGGENIADKCLQYLLEDANVDAVISLIPPMILPPGPPGSVKPEQIRALLQESAKRQAAVYRMLQDHDKPLFYIRRMNIAAAVTYQKDWPDAPPHGVIPEYTHPRRAAHVLRYLAAYRHYLES
jgi:acyl-CoA synthetase (NDP forming)